MGFFDYVADVYSSISMMQPEAEERPDYQGQPDTSGEQSSSKDTRSGGVGTAQQDRSGATRGGASTTGAASGTDEESDDEKEVNAEDAEKAKSRSSGDDSSAKTSDGSGAVPDTDDGDDEGGDAEEEEEDEDDDEPKDPKPRLEEECMKTTQCYPLKHHYDECAERVQKQIDESGKPEEDCVEEYFHLMHCASQCASAKLFRSLR